MSKIKYEPGDKVKTKFYGSEQTVKITDVMFNQICQTGVLYQTKPKISGGWIDQDWFYK